MDIIKDFLVKNVISDGDKIDLGYEDSLIETGIIDSLAIVKIIAFLEGEFKIIIGDDDILAENFESIKSMSVFIDMRKSN